MLSLSGSNCVSAAYCYENGDRHDEDIHADGLHFVPPVVHAGGEQHDDAEARSSQRREYRQCVRHPRDSNPDRPEHFRNADEPDKRCRQTVDPGLTHLDEFSWIQGSLRDARVEEDQQQKSLANPKCDIHAMLTPAREKCDKSSEAVREFVGISDVVESAYAFTVHIKNPHRKRCAPVQPGQRGLSGKIDDAPLH